MSSKLSYMPFHINDFRNATRHLTLEEVGAYRTLLDSLWLLNDYLPDDDDELAGHAGATKEEWARVRQRVLKFFTHEPGRGYTQKRVEKEKAKVNELMLKRKKAGQASAAARDGGNVTKFMRL